MPNPPQKHNPAKNRIFTVTCPLRNVVYLTEKTWQSHSIPRHIEQDLVGDLGEVKSTIEQASRARRSTHPNHGQDTCVYERIITETNSLMRIPVLFESPDYDQGQRLGKILSVFMVQPGEWDTGYVGDIFWTANEVEKDEE